MTEIIDGYITKPFPTMDIINRQWRKGRYNRMDIFVRYMCVEEYMQGRNGKAWKLYRKMQWHRNRFGPQYTKKRIKEFHKLIDSIRANGYDMTLKGIRCDSDMELVNGSHRLAVCLYFGIETIGVKYPCDHKKVRSGYSDKWFRKKGFSEKTIARIEAVRKKVMS